LLTIFALSSWCGAADLKIGAPAPPLTLRQLLQAPSGTDVTLETLKGSVVVLEFWATWCAGCRDQIPHWNRLEEQFRDKPVRFISLTDEEPGIVQRFLKDYPISGWIGLDFNEQISGGTTLMVGRSRCSTRTELGRRSIQRDFAKLCTSRA
jgi:thiol-disulfide isomerase/thioredoxin